MYVHFSSEDPTAEGLVKTWDDFRVDLPTPLFLYNKGAFECCLVELSVTEKTKETTPLPLRNSVLSVCCDLAEPSPIGGQLRPVLRRVNVRSFFRAGCVQFGTPLYVGTVGNRVDGFRLYIRQEENAPVSVSNAVTRGTLHVRARASV